MACSHVNKKMSMSNISEHPSHKFDYDDFQTVNNRNFINEALRRAVADSKKSAISAAYKLQWALQ